jgi:small subunit ribosomal protein S16
MLMIRLSRIGKKKQPTFRLIVSEKTKDPWGDYLELLGNYNPRTKAMNLKEDRIKHWLEKGAQPSDTVQNLLIKAGLSQGAKKKSVYLTKKRKAKIEGKKAKPATAEAEDKPAEVKTEPEA